MVKEERRERDRKPRKLAIKYVCMDAFTKSQARGNRAEFQRGRVALSLFLSLSLSLSLFLSRSGVVASCFPEGRIYNFVSLRQVSREGTKRHRGGDARRRTRLVKVFSSQGTHIPGYVPFLQLARLETNGYPTTRFSESREILTKFQQP